jgi:hypothetical protein
MHSDEDLKKERGKNSPETESIKMSETPYQINNSEPAVKHDLVEGLMMDIMTNISQNTTALTDHESMMNEDNNMDVEAIFEDKSAFNIAVTESDDDGDGDDEDGGEGVPSAPNKNKDKTKWSEEEVGWIILKNCLDIADNPHGTDATINWN